MGLFHGASLLTVWQPQDSQSSHIVPGFHKSAPESKQEASSYYKSFGLKSHTNSFPLHSIDYIGPG